VLATAGSFSAISALFGGPLVGGVMMVESASGLGAAMIPTLLPGFVSAGVGHVLFVGLGSWGGLNAQGLAVPSLPLYDGTHVLDLLIAIVIGVAAAFVIVAVRRFAGEIAGRGEQRLGMPVLLLGGGLAVGALAELADALGANSQDVLFSGQTSVPDLVAQDSTKIVLILLVAKAIAYAVSLGCGFRGGPVFPAIFLGIALTTLTVIWFDASPTLAVAVGSAAGMAAMTRLLLTSILFATLLGRNCGPGRGSGRRPGRGRRVDHRHGARAAVGAGNRGRSGRAGAGLSSARVERRVAIGQPDDPVRPQNRASSMTAERPASL
jgi:chloride channel protein, CIC family